MPQVFLTGSTGFMGRSLSSVLLHRGYRVRALARHGSERRVTPGCEIVSGDPLDGATYRDSLEGIHTFVHLVGVAHPNPSRAAEFRSVDLRSAQQAAKAAAAAGVSHFIYVSVAHPAPIMREYIAARQEGEAAIHAAGLNATILRPWYVLGPGRRWPLFLLPAYFVLELLPKTRESAKRLGLVSLPQMVAALANAVDRPATGTRVLEVPDIRTSGL